jgi:hypothetical protein
MTQGKIERYHRSMKNRILLDNYYLPGQLEQKLGGPVDWQVARFRAFENRCRVAETQFPRGKALLIDNLGPPVVIDIPQSPVTN